MKDTRLSQVLVVENDPAVGAMLEAALGTIGCEVIKARSLAAALVQAAQRPRLITLDVNLPDGDGRLLLDYLAGEPALQRIPVVVISGGKAPIPALHRRRVVASLGKPFPIEALFDAVQPYIGTSQPTSVAG